MPHNKASFKLLEINVISAQDLAVVSNTNMRTFGVAWLNPDRKLKTRVDQIGHNNPTWNEKFVFRVENHFIEDETSIISFEIYASTMFKDVLVGSVSVLLTHLIPPSLRTQKPKSKMRYITLQIRRPSGRSQGILNVGVTLLDGNLRSMPLCSELSASALDDYLDIDHQTDNNSSKKFHTQDYDLKDHASTKPITPLIFFQRSKSDKSTTDFHGSIITGSEMGRGSDNKGIRTGIGKGSMISDVGPSASVVAAAIANGLYPTPPHDKSKEEDNGSSSIIDDRTENDSVEGLRTKIERWKAELPPIYDNKHQRNYFKPSTPRCNTELIRRPKKAPGGGLLSCFGGVGYFEFSISCGGGGSGRKKKKKNTKTRSGVTFDGESFLII